MRKTAKFQLTFDIDDAGDFDASDLIEAVNEALNRARMYGVLTPINDDTTVIEDWNLVHLGTLT